MSRLEVCVGSLNLADGASRGNPGLSGGGGVIRDHHGTIVYAFSCFYGDTTNTMAELQALFHGVRWLYDHDHRGAIVEMDSYFLFDCLTKGHKPPWKCIYMLRSIMAMQRDCLFIFQHCYRRLIQ